MLLTAFTLTLESPEDAILPHHLGRANYASALKRLNLFDPGISTSIHEGNGPKPLTCSSVLDAPIEKAGMRVRAGTRYRVRITGLTASVSHALLEVLAARRPHLWELDRHCFTIERVDCDEGIDPSSGYATYEQLVEDRLKDGRRLSKTIPLHFASPVSFNSNGVQIPMPMPDYLFGSLVERWNTFSEHTLKPDFRQFARTNIVVSYFDMKSRPVRHKNGSMRMGGVGETTYRVLDNDYLVTAHILADFAKFAGVGVQTTTGMGQCWRVPSPQSQTRANSRHIPSAASGQKNGVPSPLTV